MFHGPNGIYANLRAARDAKIAWWNSMEPIIAAACIARNSRQNGSARADCEFMAYLFVAKMKMNVNVAYWTAAHVAENMERIAVEACSELYPCHGKKVGDPVSGLGDILSK